jgi:NADPH:quinone reductase and related Zn-dependent oxidoreductases
MPTNLTDSRPRPNLVPRPTIGRLRLRPTRRGRGFIVGVVDAVGPDTNGFAPRDRVAWRDTGQELAELILIDQDDVLGVPSWISDEKVVSYLGAGLIARALVRTRPFSRGEQVRVESRDPLVAAMTAAWARSLGADVVDASAAKADVALHDDLLARRRGAGSSHGRLAQAAVEVFQAIRAGVFDDVPLIPAGEGRLAA